MAASKGVGWFDSIEAAASGMAGKAVAAFEPDPTRRARYAELLEIYADLWPQVAAWNERLVRFADASSPGRGGADG
jgi:hypothetical protein